MFNILSIIWFVLILSVIVGIHEFGHFTFAKLFKTYVYEFSIGMGKKLFGKKKKGGETEFCFRAVPLGGYVMIAGEDDEDKDIPKDRQMCNKGFFARFSILFAGPLFNFLFAFVILFVSALIWGSVSLTPYVGDVSTEYPAYEAGLEKGDLVLSINGEKISSWDKGLVILQTSNGSELVFKVKKSNGDIVDYKIKPVKVVDEEGNESYKFGIATRYEKEYGFIKSLKYAFVRTGSLFESMWDTIKYLFNGRVGVNQLSGPVGIYSVVNSQAKEGLEAVLYLVAYLSINVGLINLLPIPAFDGGRILFLIIEKIIEKVFKKSYSKKIEGMVNTIGFFIIIGLFVLITFNDVFRLIK